MRRLEPVELHVFPRGTHGLGMASGAPGVCRWPDLAAAFLRARGWPLA
jgi:hypothetical protein